MRPAKQIEIKGDFVKRRNKFIYKDAKIICERNGSVVEVKKKEIIVCADVTGIDKIYFEIKNNRIKISDKLKDFLNNELNPEFIAFQNKTGYVPYPFTLLKNVRKSPPGLNTIITIESDKRITFTYAPSPDLKILNTEEKFDKTNFRKKFESLLRGNSRPKKLVSSFSGGFDSLLLTEAYKGECKHLLHFHDNQKVDIQYYKKKWPDLSWTIIDDYQKFSEKDRENYFRAVDEPSYDSAGFAEYLMAKQLIKEKKANYPIMNGQGADGLFCSSRMYFQDYVSSKIGHHLKKLITNKKRESLIISKLYNYSIDVKTRFFQYYLQNYEFDQEIMREFENIYSLYQGSIQNDSTNFYAALIFLLKYSLHGIEKIKTATRAFNVKYYLPFCSLPMIKYAFGIPAKHKIGYPLGKKILTQAYTEFPRAKYITGPFLPNRLKEAFAESNKKVRCETYFTNKWAACHLKKQRL